MKNWYDIYPKGTKEGDIEEKIFKTLTRNKKWKFRSISGLSRELKIKEDVIEKIVLKYSKIGVIIQNPQNDMQWGYWQTCGIDKKKSYSVQEFDYRKRLSKYYPDEITNDNDDNDDEYDGWGNADSYI
jgi:hypothetical protein